MARAKSISVRVKPRRACILSIKRIYHLVRYGSYLWEFTPKKEGFLPDGDGGGLGLSGDKSDFFLLAPSLSGTAPLSGKPLRERDKFLLCKWCVSTWGSGIPTFM